MRIDFILARRMRPVKLITVRAKCKTAIIGLPAAGRGALRDAASRRRLTDVVIPTVAL